MSISETLSTLVLAEEAAAQAYNAAVVDAIEASCPVKIGETITINGYAHKGKLMVVDQINVKRSVWKQPHTFEWIAFGYIIKQNLEVGRQRGEWRKPITE